MRRIYEAAAYGPQGDCYWADTVTNEGWPSLQRDQHCDVAVIGGGFTGLNAALEVAQQGAHAIVLEAAHPGWGASGRNGGFCCLGGSKLTERQVTRLYGTADAEIWERAQSAAVDYVSDLIAQGGWEVDRHSTGETLVAHKPSVWRALNTQWSALPESARGTLIPKDALKAAGLNGPWYGAYTTDQGFALNPRKYHRALAKACQTAGASLYAQSPVTALRRNGLWRLTTPHGEITADRVILATNGYSSEDLPDWLRARYLPVQSSVIVTRQMHEEEFQAQGWTSRQMAYDSRMLLHYFRRLPEDRFLFGMRGGLRATPKAAAQISAKIRANFRAFFPKWADVDITHEWSGLVCMMPGLVPFVGAVPDAPGLFASMGFHGNGVAMGSYAGRAVGRMALGLSQDRPLPGFVQRPPKRFPLGQYRRALLAPGYWLGERFDL